MNSINDPRVSNIIEKLYQKSEEDGQDLPTQLEGFLYTDYLKYWDYIHLDTLLSIQNPKTDIPDEQVFIVYHQITELYFKLIILELEQITGEGLGREDFVLNKLQRINTYFEQLISSFEIILKGLDPEQFLKFRLALSPASGFQSIQFRLIEMLSTEINNLVDETDRNISDGVEDSYEKLYWKKGAIDSLTQKKTLSLIHFEKKYGDLILREAYQYKNKNLAYLYKTTLTNMGNENIIAELKKFDSLANIMWPLTHYKTAVKHLLKNAETVPSTGGTNWRKYLPPKYRKIIFFPELWSEEEKENWGKNWFLKEVLNFEAMSL